MKPTHRFATAVIVFLIAALAAMPAMARGTSKASPPPTSNASGPLTLTVDCSKGQTIAHALQQGDERKELVVIVRGTCNENVTINRDKVTLQGGPGTGATVNAPDASTDAIIVEGTDISIVGLTVTGGLRGVRAIGVQGVTILDSVIQNAAQNGIHVISSHANIVGNTIQYSGNHGMAFSAANGRVQDNQIRSNAKAGVYLQQLSALSMNGNTITANGSNGVEVATGSYASLVNSQIMSNSSHGVTLDQGSSISISGSTVSSNGAAGVWLYSNSTAVIDGCTIAANGTDAAAPQLVRVGVSVNFSHADIRNSSITNHPYRGIVTTGTLLLGNTTVTGNGADGVVLYNGAKLGVTGGTISNNNGNGVFMILNSSGQILGATIQSNAKHGIELLGGSKLWLFEPPSTVGGNGFYGLYCNDGESSVNDTSWLNFTPPNSVGGAYCTGF
jgi:parallel beta-helix repeat protein